MDVDGTTVGIVVIGGDMLLVMVFFFLQRELMVVIFGVLDSGKMRVNHLEVGVGCDLHGFPNDACIGGRK